MHKYKVAVITRTKDRPLFLARAIKSVQQQNYDDLIQIIINDGGNKDAVDSLIAELAPSRVKVIHNVTSTGMEAATNKALSSVDSEYIAIHDDDDTWHPEFIQRSVDCMESMSATGVVVRTEKITEIVEGNAIRTIKSEQWMPDMKVVNLYRQCIDNQLTPITFIYRRSALDSVGLYDEELPVLGDWDFGLRFLQKYDVEFLDPGFALAYYHHRKFIDGAEGNTNFGNSAEKHRYYTNRILNKHLRTELAEGRLGVGFIMSQLRYNRSYSASVVKKLLPSFVTNKLKSKVG